MKVKEVVKNNNSIQHFTFSIIVKNVCETRKK